jgi:hypothetical protein
MPYINRLSQSTCREFLDPCAAGAQVVSESARPRIRCIPVPMDAIGDPHRGRRWGSTDDLEDVYASIRLDGIAEVRLGDGCGQWKSTVRVNAKSTRNSK